MLYALESLHGTQDNLGFWKPSDTCILGIMAISGHSKIKENCWGYILSHDPGHNLFLSPSIFTLRTTKDQYLISLI